MLSDEIQPGDELREHGALIYTVVEVHPNHNPHVVARVKFTKDGGYGSRMWERGKEVPLTRPT
jgi:hypothetical protein